jgi:hypothetical protein
MDGMVAIKDAILPGAPYAIVDKCNHSAVVWDKLTTSKFKSSDIALAVLKVVFDNNLTNLNSQAGVTDQETPNKKAKRKKPKHATDEVEKIVSDV